MGLIATTLAITVSSSTSAPATPVSAPCGPTGAVNDTTSWWLAASTYGGVSIGTPALTVSVYQARAVGSKSAGRPGLVNTERLSA